MEVKNNYKICPVLQDPDEYTPDIVDLLSNETARNYWLITLEGVVKKFVDKAENLNPENPKATEHAQACLQKFHNLVEQIKLDPLILKPLTVRTLLDYNEENLRVHFKDAWQLQKETETLQALKTFSERIQKINSIGDFNKKWEELTKGVLAGNVFDWGSTVVAKIMDTSPSFGLSHAMDIIERRPWFIDDLDLWLKRLKNNPYECAIIFVDNAGIDFILGILPFTRELLSMGTKVVLAANSYPSLNDVTYADLQMYCSLAGQYCTIIKDAMLNQKLVTVENGQKGPCLDLAHITSDLYDMMTEADLIIIEGMGRAVHTNLNAKFKVDSLKIAALKNEWLAKTLGAKQFSVIFKYEPKIPIRT
ncbi:4'-phosphopantetheine phosphatase [Rhynchophorus ferrugineus]|uniref:4'-phosphopantetheine phosphatase n=1 Tax=Rhynchophorus ferrugineus TaxID=354439 RepID=A0A834HZX1_RHYFE|nr:hypothetical protein GWI33_017038 [Rhynchophorus ferrugineus]